MQWDWPRISYRSIRGIRGTLDTEIPFGWHSLACETVVKYGPESVSWGSLHTLTL
jgi:hypothetical protein